MGSGGGVRGAFVFGFDGIGVGWRGGDGSGVAGLDRSGVTGWLGVKGNGGGVDDFFFELALRGMKSPLGILRLGGRMKTNLVRLHKRCEDKYQR
ncbi:MAG: hypothetical protein E6K19_08155 [Methanobacteriota archaeon]|nr:MAG: hypothetical protein E6K19_08155 [Euryarchaeota archaeon]